MDFVNCGNVSFVSYREIRFSREQQETRSLWQLAAHNFRLKSQGVLVRVTEMLVSSELQLHGRSDVITPIARETRLPCTTAMSVG